MKKFFVLMALTSLLFGCKEQPHPQSLSVMSFNIRVSPDDDFDADNSWKHRKTASVALINDLKPDLLGVQEAYPRQASWLEDALTDYQRYGAEDEDAQARGECNLIFFRKDKFEKLDCGTFWLSQTPDTVSTGWDGAYRRVALWVRLKDETGRELYFFNTHFDHIGDTARTESGKLIIRRMNEIAPEGTPVFLTGDFNTNYDDVLLRPLREKLLNARETALVTDTLGTYHEWLSFDALEYGHTIDHIWYSGAEAISYRTVTESYGLPCVSDHYPVIACFNLK